MIFSFRTSPPANYITPSGDEMREMAKKVGIKSFSRDLVADLCNLAAGGKINSPSTYRSEVEKRVEETLPAPSPRGEWDLPEGGRTQNRFDVITSLTARSMKYHINVCDFIQAIDLNKIPGSSPLEQAMSLLKLLSKQNGGSGGGEGGEPLPIFTGNDRPEEVAENIHETLDIVDSLSSDEMDMIDPKGENHTLTEKEEDGQRSGNNSLNKLKIAEDLVQGTSKRIMLDVSRTLDTFTKLQSRKQVREEADPMGEEVKKRPMRVLSELSKVAPSAWAIRQQSPSHFLYQAVTGQLPVRERVTRVERKQAIFILLDGSGSMSGTKHWKASGIVMNRLKAVINGDAVVYLSVFDTEMHSPAKATTPEEARELIKQFMNKNFSGGGTDIASAIKSAHKYMGDKIAAGELLYKPEIVVLTDEDTSTNGLKVADVPGTKVHGFAIERSNQPLVTFARSTGGVGVENF